MHHPLFAAIFTWILLVTLPVPTMLSWLYGAQQDSNSYGTTGAGESNESSRCGAGRGTYELTSADISPELFREIARIPMLQRIVFDDCGGNWDFSALRESDSLHIIALIDCAITDDDLESLASISSLRSIVIKGDMEEMDITLDGVFQLGACRKLENLTLPFYVAGEPRQQLRERFPEVRFNFSLRDFVPDHIFFDPTDPPFPPGELNPVVPVPVPPE